MPLFVAEIVFRVRVGGVRVTVVIGLVIRNVRRHRCRGAGVRVGRLLHGFGEEQLNLRGEESKSNSTWRAFQNIQSGAYIRLAIQAPLVQCAACADNQGHLMTDIER